MRLFRRDQGVLVTRDLAGDERRRQVAVDLLEDTFLVVGVDDDEVVLAPEAVDMELQKQQPELVEGTQQRRITLRRDHREGAFAHLLGRLVGKGQRQRIARGHPDHVQQVSEARGDRRRLSAAGPGQDQQRPFRLPDGRCLYLVQVFEYMFHFPLFKVP